MRICQLMATIGVCGDNCSYCPRYVATQKRDAKELERVKDLWVRLGFWDPAFPAQDLTCLGCRPENKCAYLEIRACAYGKGVENCGLCQAYPCRLINAAFEKSDNLRSYAARVCTPKEMDILQKAFFSKRKILDQTHSETNKRK